MQYLNGKATLPSHHEMLTDSGNELKKRLALGWPKKKGHSVFGTLQREYYNDMSTAANMENVREIFMLIYDDTAERRWKEPIKYRNDIYRIIDELHFERNELPID